MDTLLEEITRASPIAPRSRASQLSATDDVLRVEAIVEKTLARYGLFGTTCLYRTLIRFVLLRQHGVDVQLVLGIADPPAPDGELIGHAWLERDGAPLRTR